MTSSLERNLARAADEAVSEFEKVLRASDLHSHGAGSNARNGFWAFRETVDGTPCVMIGTRGDPRRFPGQLLRWIWSFERPGQRELWQRPGGQPLECFIRLSLAPDDFIQTLYDLRDAVAWVESLYWNKTRAWAANAFKADPPYHEWAAALTPAMLRRDGDGEDERDGEGEGEGEGDTDTTLTSVAVATAGAASPDPAPAPVPVPATTADARRLRETADALDALRASLLDDVNAALVGRRADGTPLPVKPGETFQRHTTGSLVVVLIKLLRQTAVSLASATEYARQGESDQ